MNLVHNHSFFLHRARESSDDDDDDRATRRPRVKFYFVTLFSFVCAISVYGNKRLETVVEVLCSNRIERGRFFEPAGGGCHCVQCIVYCVLQEHNQLAPFSSKKVLLEWW